MATSRFGGGETPAKGADDTETGKHLGDGANRDHEQGPTAIHLPEEKQRVAGIRVERARRGDFTGSTPVTGKIALNEDRVTRIHPLVEGRVHEVQVQFGDEVKAGQLLAIIDSREVGRAKLDLYKSIREAELAQVNHQWQRKIHENTALLIEDLQKDVPITQIEKKYPDMPMGEYRQQLLSAYAALYKADADYRRLSEVSERGIVAGKQLISAEAARDVAQATFSAAIEQIKFMAYRNELSAKQDLEKAQTTEAIHREILGILGYQDVKMEDIDPAVQGEAISHYEVRAPFDGTVISKDIVLMDQVDPSEQMFTIADFSSVWVRADVYEKQLPLLDWLAGKTISLRADSYPDRVFQATVFYTGDTIDQQTRTADMRAIVRNPDRLLKPGMFVELELPAETVADVLHVPASALQTHEGKTFVFVRKGEGSFERRDVQTGRTADGSVEILSGLKEEEPVVVAGGFALKSEMLSELIGEEE